MYMCICVYVYMCIDVYVYMYIYTVYIEYIYLTRMMTWMIDIIIIWANYKMTELYSLFLRIKAADITGKWAIHTTDGV